MNNDSTPQHPIPQEAFDWYDEYAHGIIDRRTFLDRLATITTAAITIGMLTSALLPNYAAAEQVSFNDEDIKATYATFASAAAGEQAVWSAFPADTSSLRFVAGAVHGQLSRPEPR